jgi:cyclic di-GMP phosphodiesterase
MNRGPILCVDDEPANLAVMRQILKDHYRLIFARSGTEALLATAKHRPSLILLDVNMPDMDGYEVCCQLKRDKLTEGIPVIFVTALADEGFETAGFDAGGVDYITKPISARILRARIRTHLSLICANDLEKVCRAAIHMLGEASHSSDTDTGLHIWRMASYSRALAEASGWDEERCGLIELAAAMHDTGKIGIPDSILKKPSELSAAEWDIMKTHTVIGYDILTKGEAPVFSLAAEVALYHHERWDGSGYPIGLAGEAIPESARIVAVADVFDALSTKRPYKEAWPMERALAVIEQSAGNHLDPDMVARFLKLRPRILDIKTRWEEQEATVVERERTVQDVRRMPAGLAETASSFDTSSGLQ